MIPPLRSTFPIIIQYPRRQQLYIPLLNGLGPRLAHFIFGINRRIRFRFKVNRLELIQRQVRRRRAFKFPHAVGDRHTTHAQNPRHIGTLLIKAVRPGGNQQGGGTNTGGSTSGHDPVAFHPGHQSQGRQRHGIGPVVQIQMCRKAVDVQGRVNDFQFQPQQSSEFQKARPERIHIDL